MNVNFSIYIRGSVKFILAQGPHRAVVPNRWAADRCRSVDQLVPGRARNTVKALLPFPTTYLYEAGFSAVTATKTKYRNKLDISNTLRVSLSPITPRWDRLIAKKQAQSSH